MESCFGRDVNNCVKGCVDYEVEVLDQWFLSFFKRDPKSGLDQKLTTLQALKV